MYTLSQEDNRWVELENNLVSLIQLIKNNVLFNWNTGIIVRRLVLSWFTQCNLEIFCAEIIRMKTKDYIHLPEKKTLTQNNE